MELMSTSLDKFYKYVYCALDDVIPEEILGKITLAVSSPCTPYFTEFGFIPCNDGNRSDVFCFVFNRPLKH